MTSEPSSRSSLFPLCGLIVDDEPYVRADLLFMLQAYPDIQIIAEADSVDSAHKILARTHVDVVFLDVQLRGGSGFELLPLIPPASEIIFVTAYNRYAVQAFEVNALDYLLKPVDEKRLAAALDRLRHKHKLGDQQAEAPVSLRQEDQTFIKTDKGHHLIALTDLVAVQAYGGNYSALHLIDGSDLLTRQTLKTWEQRLPPQIFLRVHRQSIVNFQHVWRVERQQGQFLLHMTGLEAPISASRRQGSGIIKMLEELQKKHFKSP